MKNAASGPFAQIAATNTKQIQNIKNENKAANLFLRFVKKYGWKARKLLSLGYKVWSNI